MIIHILSKVGALFLILAVGALVRYKKVITADALGVLSNIVLYVTLPFLFIYVLSSRCIGSTLLSLWPAPVMSAAIIFTGWVMALAAAALLRLSPERRGTFLFLVSFQNSGFLAIPLAFALFGEDGVLNVIIFNVGFNALFFTFGAWLLSHSKGSIKKDLLKNLMNTTMAALLVGVLLGAFCIELPKFLLDAAKMLGDVTIPLAMLVAGAMLAGNGFKKAMYTKEMVSLVFLKLVLMPLVFLLAVRYVGQAGTLLGAIVVLQASMPSASLTPLMAKRFGGDYDLAASGVFVTTLVSIITIPFFMSLALR